MRIAFPDIQRFAVLPLLAATLFTGCAEFPNSGPSRREVVAVATSNTPPSVQVVDIDDRIARRLLSRREQQSFAESLGQAPLPPNVVGPGDTVEITVWEAPPATLFAASADPRAGVATTRFTPLPEQVVSREGYVVVPFAGRVQALGRTPEAIGTEIAERLRGKANQPDALVRITRSPSSSVTVIGDVANSLRLPLTQSGERVLDALAAAGGVRQPVNKVMLQVTRGDSYYAMPLDKVIRDPRQNVPLRSGDVVTAIFQPFSFTALGATGRNEEVNFEAQGITLAQALARAGGLIDNRANAQGAFIFRFESRDALEWPTQPVQVTPDGMVPVVYRVNLNDPLSFFVMQSFAINNRDVLYVSNSPAAELQKFLNIIFSGLYPILTTIQVTH